MPTWLLLLALLPSNNLSWLALLTGSLFFPWSSGWLLLVLPLKLLTPLFDPLLDQVGHALLVQPVLAPLWVAARQIPLVPLTAYHHTLVMGTLALSPVLWALVFSLQWVVRQIHWRKRLGRRRRARWRCLAMMLLAIGLGGTLLTKDAWLSGMVAQELERLTGAQVELEGFSWQLLRGKASFSSLAVINPQKPTDQLFQLRDGEFDIVSSELLRGRFVVETLTSFSAPPREEGWAAPQGGTLPTSPAVPANLPTSPELQVYGSLGAAALVEQLADYYQERIATWGSIGRERIAELQQLRQRMEEMVSRKAWPKDSTSLQQRIRELQQLRSRSRALISQSEEDIRSISRDTGEVEHSWETVSLQLQRDLEQQQLKKAVFLPLQQPLLSHIVQRRLAQWEMRFAPLSSLWARTVNRDAEELRPTGGRRHGRIMMFTSLSLPHVLFKNILVKQSGGSRWELHNLSSQPQSFRKPLVVRWQGHQPDGQRSMVNAVFAFYKDQFNVQASFTSWPLTLREASFAAGSPVTFYQGQADYQLWASGSSRELAAELAARIRTRELRAESAFVQTLLHSILTNQTLIMTVAVQLVPSPWRVSSLESNVDRLVQSVWQEGGEEWKQILQQQLTRDIQRMWQQKVAAPAGSQLTELEQLFIDGRDSIGQHVLDLEEEAQRLELLLPTVRSPQEEG